jgi:hypothetical protein
MPLKRLMISYIRLNLNELGTPKPLRALAALSATKGGSGLSLAFFGMRVIVLTTVGLIGQIRLIGI